MDDLIWPTDAQMTRIEPHFSLSNERPRVDTRKVLWGIVFVIMNELGRRDAPKTCGPHKTLYNRFIR